MKNEPLVTVATLTSIVGAVIGVLVAFGFPLSGEQQTAILGLTTVIAPLIVALVVRPRVTPVPGPDPGQGGRIEPLYALVCLFVGVVVLIVLLELVQRL